MEKTHPQIYGSQAPAEGRPTKAAAELLIAPMIRRLNVEGGERMGGRKRPARTHLPSSFRLARQKRRAARGVKITE